MTHHITVVGDRNILCRASPQVTEVRNLDTGVRWKTLDIPGLNCTVEVNGIIYCGSQFKAVYALSATTFEVLGSVQTEGSVNSLSLGNNSGMLIAGQTAGVVAIFEIGKSKETGEAFMQKCLET